MRMIFLIGLILAWSVIAQGKVEEKEYNPLQIEAKIFFNKGFKLYQGLNFEEAVICYKKAIDLQPEFLEAWFWLGKAYYRDGLLDQAASAWQKYINLGGKTRHRDIERKLKMYLQPEIETTSAYHPLVTISGQELFAQPIAVAIDKKDNLYVLSFGSPAILKFSPSGEFLQRLGEEGKKEGQFNQPFGLALDRAGNIYVTDWGNHRVEKFNPAGECLLTFGQKGSSKGEFIGPEGIQVDRDGIIYVVDNGNSRIQCFSPNGRFLSQIGHFGDGQKGLFHPTGIALDNKGGLWVTDTGNKSLKRFDLSGNLIESFKFPEKRAEGRGITFGTDLNLYVAFGNNHLWRFNPQEKGWTKLEINAPLINPMGLAMNQDGVIYIADFDNNLVQVVMPDSFTDKGFDLTVDKINIREFPIVTCQVMVSTKDGRPFLGLTNKNFKVIDGGYPILPVTITSPLVDNDYLIISLVLDKSSKMGRYEAEVKRLIYQLAKHIKPEQQAVSLRSVTDKVVLELDNNRNKTALRNCIDQIDYEGELNDETLFSTLLSTTKDLLGFDVKRAIVFFSQGKEVSTSTLFKKTVYLSRHNHIPIFVVDLRREGRTESLARLAKMSGGRYILAHNSPEVKRLYQVINDYTSSFQPYLVTYRSLDRGWANNLTRVDIWSGYHQLMAQDLGDYIVPPDKGMTVEKIEILAQKVAAKKYAEWVEEHKEEQAWEDRLKLLMEGAKGGEHGGGEGGGHGGEEAPKPKKRPAIEEKIEINIGSPVRPLPGSEEAKPAAAGHGGGH